MASAEAPGAAVRARKSTGGILEGAAAAGLAAAPAWEACSWATRGWTRPPLVHCLAALGLALALASVAAVVRCWLQPAGASQLCGGL